MKVKLRVTYDVIESTRYLFFFILISKDYSTATPPILGAPFVGDTLFGLLCTATFIK